MFAKWTRALQRTLSEPGKESAHGTQSTPPWSWVAVTVADLLVQYPLGLTEAIILSELERKWNARGYGVDILSRRRYETLEKLFESEVGFETCFEAVLDGIETLPGGRTHILLHRNILTLQQHDIPLNSLSIQLMSRSYKSSQTRLLPTEHIAFVLDSHYDTSLIESYFGKDTLLHINDRDIVLGRQYFIWAKVRIDSDGYVIYSWPASRLILYDEQIAMANFVREGDYVGIYQPFVDPDLLSQSSTMELEYGTATVLFVLPSSDEYVQNMTTQSSGKSANLTEEVIIGGQSLLRDDQASLHLGLLDCAPIVERLQIADLKPKMVHVTLYGRVNKISENMPSEDSGVRIDRHAIRLEDDTGAVDITFWGSTAQSIRTVQQGHFVLITGMAAASKPDGSTTATMNVILNASDITQARLINVSTMSALLTSVSIFPRNFLSQLLDQDQFVFNGIVTGWKILSNKWDEAQPQTMVSSTAEDLLDRIIYLAHSVCKRMLEREAASSVYYCPFCRMDVIADHDIVYSFGGVDDSSEIIWDLDDGTAALQVLSGSSDVVQSMLGCDAESFRRLTDEDKFICLDSVVGREMHFGVTLLVRYIRY
ncbi:hypothetical protein BZG36_01679 [Bifiguratus adelaidae]|uniref:Uncharacterized protein n=1 Tax=Bifiguratus adelaidae TaxID=1938954 RepID=A0A261Y4K3_9FUNG|nr:hypothetical protein BZG36_01679 [Bifiguratus adelaidae]